MFYLKFEFSCKLLDVRGLVDGLSVLYTPDAIGGNEFCEFSRAFTPFLTIGDTVR